MNILLADETHPLVEQLLVEAGHKVAHGYDWPKAAVAENLKHFEGLILRSRFTVDAAFLNRVAHLKFIGRFGSGMENIDIDHANSLGIACLNAPEGNRDAVGEHCVAMLLTLFNRIAIAQAEVRSGFWRRTENMGEELQGKTVGIVGFGNMGSAFAEKLSGFGVKVLAHDKYKTDFSKHHVQEASLEEIHASADVVSLHLPLNYETAYYANDQFFNAFQKPIYFINTSRGGVLDTSALVDAMQEGKIKGACLDVLEYEKSSFENIDRASPDLKYLLYSDVTIITPHIAGWSHQSFEKMARVLVRKILMLKSFF